MGDLEKARERYYRTHYTASQVANDAKSYVKALEAALAEAREAVKNHAEAVTRLHDTNLTAEALLMALTSIGSRLGLDRSASPKVVMGAFERYCEKAEQERDALKKALDVQRTVTAGTIAALSPNGASEDRGEFEE